MEKLAKCLPELHKCCCFSVKTGSIIIAVYDLIYMPGIGILVTLIGQPPSAHYFAKGDDGTGKEAFYVSAQIGCFASPILAVLLLWGICMVQKLLVLMWILGTYIKMGFLLTAFVSILITYVLHPSNFSEFYMFFPIIALMLLLTGFWVCVVGSYYNETFDNEDN